MTKLFTLLALLMLSACSELGYYWHSTSGHMSIMNKRVKIDNLLQDPALDNRLKQRLLLVREIRQFAIDRLALPDNGSYTSYAQLDRPYALQNLFAAPEFSTELHQWCYPIAGCTSYRGYFDEDLLQNYVMNLEQQNFETYIGGVAAYSTLGWFDDPVLSSFIDWPDYRLAGLLFHELTHQRLYLDDDTGFNESLASSVQQAGTLRWLASRDDQDQLAEFKAWLAYHSEVVALIERTRAGLTLIYQQDLADTERRKAKSSQLDAARAAYREISQRRGISDGFGAWFAGELNNAKLGSVAAYQAQVPAFVAMLEALDHDFVAFFEYTAQLGKLPKEQRDRCLALWQAGTALTDTQCRSGFTRAKVIPG